MKLAIMQPYLLPFRHYFRLIAAVDLFVAYDDVSYMKGGFINRNRICVNGTPQWLTVPILKASPNKKISELFVCEARHKTILKTVAQAYCKTPHFAKVFPIVEKIILYPDLLLSHYTTESLRAVANYLGIATPIEYSSALRLGCGLRGQDRVLEICRQLRASTYVNLAGGVDLYDPAAFRAIGCELRFIDSKPALSIVDDLMLGRSLDDDFG